MQKVTTGSLSTDDGNGWENVHLKLNLHCFKLNSAYFISFRYVKCWQTFLGLNFKGLYRSSSSSHAVMAKKWTKIWMHEQNYCFANLNLLLFWLSHCHHHQHPHCFWFAAILSCLHSVYCTPLSSPLHFHFLSVWKVLLHALHWAHGSVAQIASHAWEHYLTYSLCTDTPSPKKNSGKELHVCVVPTLIVFHRCLSPRHFF